MNKLEQAYELLNGDETDVKKAEQLYLEVYKNIKSTQSEKAEAASQLGCIYFGDFDDVDEDVVLKDLVKSKKFFKQSIAKGNKDDALTLSQIYCKDANSMTEEIEFAISTLLNEKMYENEVIDAIDIYVKKLFVNSITKLLNLYNKLSSYQSKTENQKIISHLIAHKKKISVTFLVALYI